MYFRRKCGLAGRHGYLALLAILACAGTAVHAAEPKSRIRYAEPVSIPIATLPRSAKLQSDGVSTTVAFDAFGRRFELELESNDRLLRHLPAGRRAELPPRELYRGRVAGLPGSWVRLARLPDGLHGALWDGNELYSILPAHAAAEFMGEVTPLTSDQTLIYRASDVDVLVGPGFCTVLDGGGSRDKRASGLEQYKALISELPIRATTAEAAPTLELEVAMIADFEFFSAEPDPAGALLSRLNVVDGIFSEQVGVAIVATELKVFDSPTDPFTTAAAANLLDEVGRYRVATPTIAAAGLAHLVTGRELVGDTVGIAYRAGVCEAEIGVSLSERFFDPFLSALIAAHEFGHNLGAPHDAEPGSPCQTTGPGFLMSRDLGDSSTFSQCSLNQMAPVVAASSCIKPRQHVDVAVELTQSVLVGHTRVAEQIGIDVTNLGAVATNPVVHIELGDSISATPVEVEGGACTAVPQGMDCNLLTLPPGESRRIDIEVTGSLIGSTFGSVVVSASGDVEPGNDVGRFELQLSAATNAAIRVQLPTMTLLSGDEAEVVYLVEVAGVLPLSAATVQSVTGDFEILSATTQTGTCSITPSTANCRLGAIEIGGLRRVTLRLKSGRAGASLSIVHRLNGTIDDTAENNVVAHSIRVNPLVDVVVRSEPGSSVVERGATFTQSFSVLSAGPREAHDARLRITWPDTLAVSNVVAEDATCVVLDSNSRDCSFITPIQSGGSRLVSLTFRAARLGAANIRANVSARGNQHVDGPLSTSAQVRIEVRVSADVAISDGVDIDHYDSNPFDVHWRVMSLGFSPSQAASLDLPLPPGITASAATTTVGACSISTGSVRCDFGELPPDAFADVHVVLAAALPGSYVLAAAASATNDASPGNNSDSIALTIHPNIDVNVDPLPGIVQAKVGRAFRYVVTVSTATQPVPDVMFGLLNVPSFENYEVLSATPSQGTCRIVERQLLCSLGTMAARSTGVLDLELRGRRAGTAEIVAWVTGHGVVDISNEFGQGTLELLPVGNASVSTSPQSTQRIAGETFSAPVITIAALSHTESVALRITVPEGLEIESGTPAIGTCEVAPSTVECEFGTLAAGEERTVELRLRAERAGVFTTRLEVLTDDESDRSNNVATFDVDVRAPEPPPSPPPPPDGGGGGGSLNWTSLMLGALGLGLRRRRRLTGPLSDAGRLHSGRCPDGPAHC